MSVRDDFLFGAGKRARRAWRTGIGAKESPEFPKDEGRKETFDTLSPPASYTNDSAPRLSAAIIEQRLNLRILA